MSKRSMVVALGLALVSVLALGTMPANAAATISGSAAALLSPRLSDGFPCGDSSLPALDALAKYATGNSTGYSQCPNGLIWSSGGAVNVGNTTGQGVAADGSAYAVAGLAGTFDAKYSYSEPCQPANSGTQAAGTGEAIGTLWTQGGASGRYGNYSVTSGKVQAKFWWSRVGLTAIIGLKDVTITLQTTGPGTTRVIHDVKARGIAAAVFIPTDPPDCAKQKVPGANGIIIASPELTFSSPA